MRARGKQRSENFMARKTGQHLYAFAAAKANSRDSVGREFGCDSWIAFDETAS
jgi:hypothetical protein